MQDAEDRSIATLVHQALLLAVRLELLPKSSLDVFVTVLEADGLAGVPAAASIAASTPLAHAGVEMIGLVTSCSAVCRIYPRDMIDANQAAPQTLVNGEVWLDPTEHEQKNGSGMLGLACLPALGTVTSTWQSGSLSVPEVFQVRRPFRQTTTQADLTWYFSA